MTCLNRSVTASAAVHWFGMRVFASTKKMFTATDKLTMRSYLIQNMHGIRVRLGDGKALERLLRICCMTARSARHGLAARACTCEVCEVDKVVDQLVTFLRVV